MSRNTLYALGGGAASALLSLIFPFGGLFAALPLLMAGLSLGALGGTIACITGFIAVGALAGPAQAGAYGLLYGVLSLVVVRQVLLHKAGSAGTPSWYPAGGVLSSLTAVAMGFLCAAAVWAWRSGGGLRQVTWDSLSALFTAVPQVDDAAREALLNMLVPIFPGLICLSGVVTIIVNGVIAQTVLVRLGRNLRPAGTFGDLTLPNWMSWLLVIPAAMSLAGPDEMRYVGYNLVLVAAIPFFFVGLSLVHRFARRAASPGLVLTVFYVSLVVFNVLTIPVAALGVIDQWFGLGKRIGGPGHDRENE